MCIFTCYFESQVIARDVKPGFVTLVVYADFRIVNVGISRQSIKKPNFWNSEPAKARSTLAMVALCSEDFKIHSDASSITPCQLVIELDALEWVCSVPSAIFCKLKNEGSWGATHLLQILFQIGKNVYGDFSDVATGLWRGLFEQYAISRVVTAFQTKIKHKQNTEQRLLCSVFWLCRWKSNSLQCNP